MSFMNPIDLSIHHKHEWTLKIDKQLEPYLDLKKDRYDFDMAVKDHGDAGVNACAVILSAAINGDHFFIEKHFQELVAGRAYGPALQPGLPVPMDGLQALAQAAVQEHRGGTNDPNRQLPQRTTRQASESQQQIHYPQGLGDGEGGCWAGHRIFECSSCHKKYSDGIWAAGDWGGGKLWSWMRKARPDELAEHGL